MPQFQNTSCGIELYVRKHLCMFEVLAGMLIFPPRCKSEKNVDKKQKKDKKTA